MKEKWIELDFENCLSKFPSYNKIPKKQFLDSGKYPIISQEKDLINGYWDKTEDLIKIKKPIVVFGDHTKVLKYIDFNFVVGADGVKIFEPIDLIDSKFFMLAIKSLKLDDLGYARHYRILKQHKINFPSLPEQQAIVEKLDFVFDAIEKAKANIEKNIENAKELFQSKLNEIINLNENDKKLLGDISQIKTGKLNSNAMIEGGIYNFFTCSREIFKINNYAFDCEAVLLAGNNASGDFNVKHFEGKFNAYQRTYVITSNPKILNLKLLKYILEGYLANFKRMSIGANTKFLKIDMIKNVEIGLPNIIEQEKIVADIDKLSLQTKLLVEKYKHKLANLEELKKSILEKAFKGELI